MSARATRSKAKPARSGSINHLARRDPAKRGEGGSILNHQAWLLALMLGMATSALYWPATHHEFLNYDDQVYVTANSHVQGGITAEGLQWAFFQPDAEYGYWHPLTLVSHMLDCQIFGPDARGHHLTNLLLHAFNTALVFLLLWRLTGRAWRSFMAAALFAVHPLHVESVAWIAERKDVLSTFFGLLTLLAYGRYAAGRNIEHPTSNAEHRIKEGRGRKSEGRGQITALRPPTSDLRPPISIFHPPSSFWWYGLALVFFACGLMCKPMLVTVPFVMLLLDWWPLRRGQREEGRGEKADAAHLSPLTSHFTPFWRLVFEKIPFFVLALAASGLTFVISKKGGVLTSGQAMALSGRIANAIISYARYLGKLFWPENLAVFYPHPGHWPLAEVSVAGVLLLAITALVLAARRRYPFLLMGWLWFVGTLVPVIGLVPVGEHAMADRYAYIPSLGLFIAVVWGVAEIAKHRPYRTVALSVAGAAAIAVCVWLTRQQLGYWQDDETLFRHALAVTRDNYIAHQALGDALDQKGEPDEAMSEFQAALRLRPEYGEAHGGLGNVLFEKGRADEAIDQYRQAIRLKPDFFESYCNLGSALLNQGRTDEAIDEFQAAIRLKPDMADGHYNLGVALGGKGDIDGAARQFQEAIRLNPNHAAAYNNLGTVRFKEGKVGEAVEDYRTALRLKPDYADARGNLARALAGTNAPAAR